MNYIQLSEKNQLEKALENYIIPERRKFMEKSREKELLFLEY